VQELISPSISLLEGLDESAGRFQTTLLSLLSFNHSHPTKPLSQTRHLEYRRILARTGTSAPLHATTYSLTSDYAQTRQGSSCEDKRNTRQAGAPFTHVAASKPRLSALELSFQLNSHATSQSFPLNQNRRGTKPQTVARAHLTSAELLQRSHKTWIGYRGNHAFLLALLIRTYIACTCNLATLACVLCYCGTVLWCVQP
jgi:hypothetical protein